MVSEESEEFGHRCFEFGGVHIAGLPRLAEGPLRRRDAVEFQPGRPQPVAGDVQPAWAVRGFDAGGSTVLR
ncbi:hypothetical protein ACFQY7_06840 [Actinomadura luteofluorescens]|uniref:hypothetical protein n=1 Tax=Actinomadura luteofluorescens TaxID=46163 RepID=UPI003639BB66